MSIDAQDVCADTADNEILPETVLMRASEVDYLELSKKPVMEEPCQKEKADIRYNSLIGGHQQQVLEDDREPENDLKGNEKNFEAVKASGTTSKDFFLQFFNIIFVKLKSEPF